MRSVYVPAWQLLVHSHRKAFDEHIRLLEFSEGQTLSLEQSETKLVAAVPTPDDGENFILGMAIDYSNQVCHSSSHTWVPVLMIRLNNGDCRACNME